MFEKNIGMEGNDLPEAICYVVYNTLHRSTYLFVMSCPFCARSHLHGVGQDSGRIRASGCRENARPYFLVCRGNMPDEVKQHFEERFG